MIPVQQARINESGGIEKAVSFGVKAADFAKLFNILRNLTYSDPILAVIREYSTNAIDAHIAAQKPNEQIVVSLPNVLDSFFKVRDFGLGLTDQEITDIYANYGSSTKERTNDETGMLGIGCKSGFAYNDSFMVNSYKDGTLTIWNAFIDTSNLGQMAKMGEVPTDEPNGIEVVIPVKNDDIHKFREKAFNLFAFFKIAPKFLNVPDDELAAFEAKRNRTPMYADPSGKWSYFGDKSPSYAVMGNIPYPVDSKVFGSDMAEELRKIIESGIILNFNIGELEFAASREALQYTPHTKKAIMDRLEGMNGDLVTEITKGFSACQTMWDAKKLFGNIFATDGKLFGLRYLLKGNIDFKGQKISSTTFATHHMRDKVTHCHYSKRTDYTGRTVGKVTRTECSEIEAKDDVLVLINDKNIINGIMNRVVGPIETGKYRRIHVLKFEDDAAMQKWMDDTGFDGPTEKLSSLVKEPLSKYYPDLATGVSGFHNPKHLSSEFTLKTPMKRFYKSSDYWDTIKVDPAQDAGIYLRIDRFDYLDVNGHQRDPRHLMETIALLQSAGVTIPQIYGLKHSSAQKAQTNANMVEFWVWMKDAINAYILANPTLEQQWVNRKYGNDLADKHYRLREVVVSGEITSDEWTTDPKSPLFQFIQSARQIWDVKNDAQLNAFGSLISQVNYVPTKKPQFDIASDAVAIKHRYPLLFRMAQHARYDLESNKELRKEVCDYIEMVDCCTP
jgi:hypothetical protein